MLDPNHLIAVNSENDPKTGRADSPQLIVEGSPPQNGEKGREAVKNKIPVTLIASWRDTTNREGRGIDPTPSTSDMG